MTLSRAAAAAARKAAKKRGLQGNRADDGSMLTAYQTQTSSAGTPATGSKIAGTKAEASSMTNAELTLAYEEATVARYNLQNSKDEAFKSPETTKKWAEDYADAVERERILGEELDAREEFAESNLPYDTEEEISPGFRS